MTRKDYVAVANDLGDILGDVRSARQEQDSDLLQGIESGISRAVTALCGTFKRDNGGFRPEQFREAVEYRANTGRIVRVGQTRFDR